MNRKISAESLEDFPQLDPVTHPLERTASIPNSYMPQAPVVEADPSANEQSGSSADTQPNLGSVGLREAQTDAESEITAETSRRALAGDEASRKAVNVYLEKASPAELMDPALSAVLELPYVRRRYLFPAVARVAKRLRRTDGALEPKERQLIRKTFDLLGFAPHQAGEIWDSWHSYNVKYTPSDLSHGRVSQDKKVGDVSQEKVDTFGKTLVDNFNRIEDIHAEDPNAVQILFRRDHIRNFARYDLGGLVSQAQPAAPVDQLVISMADDHNGIANTSLGESLYMLNANSGSSKSKRFVEAATADEVRSLLDVAAAEAGPQTNVVFVGHSTHSSLYFSHRSGGTITSEDIMGGKDKPPLLDNTVISRGARVMILGCEAGVKNGIAATMAKQLHVRARSPDVKTLGLERSYWGRLKSKTSEGESQAIPVYGINPARALAARLKAVRERRRRAR